MTNTRIHRFDFGTLRDFRGPIAVKAAATIEVEAPAPPPPPTFSESDLEAARLAGKKEGYAEGFAAGKQDAAREADTKTLNADSAILQLVDMMIDASHRYKALLQNESSYLGQLTLSVARKVAAEAIDARGEQVIMAVIERCLPVIFSKPRLIIEVNPEVFERTLERVESFLRESSFEGEIQFKANPEMGMSDVRLDWGSGQVNHSAATLWEEIDTLIARVPLEITFAETLNTNEQSTGE